MRQQRGGGEAAPGRRLSVITRRLSNDLWPQCESRHGEVAVFFLSVTDHSVAHSKRLFPRVRKSIVTMCVYMDSRRVS